MKLFGVAIAIVLTINLFGLMTGAAAPVAGERLPPGAAFGDDWTLLRTVPASASLPSAFRDWATGIYAGPNGSRVVAEFGIVAEGLTAVRQSWEIGNEVDEDYRSSIDYHYESSRERETAGAPLPPGCADARRIYGVDKLGAGAFPVGLTLCAADPNLILVVYASGEIHGLSGYQASDFVVESILQNQTASLAPSSTPRPTERPEATVANVDRAVRTYTITSHDIYFDPKELTIPANTDVTIKLPNDGAAPHNFSIDALPISVDLPVEEIDKTVTINAPAGTYQYYCNVPGHKEAGMVGTLTIIDNTSTTPLIASSTATITAGTPVASSRTTAVAPSAADMTPLLDLLPNASQAPEGLTLTNEAERSKSDVAATIGGTDEATRLLGKWGWQDNAYREFTAPADNTSPAGSVTYLNVSVHRFGSPQGAHEALTYFANYVVSMQGLQEVQVDTTGDATRGFSGAPDSNALAILFVRSGSLVYRIGTATNSIGGDPMSAATAVAKTMLHG